MLLLNQYYTNGVLTRYEFKYGLNTLVLYTLVEPVDPWISAHPEDFTVQEDYSSFTLQWTANDLSPNTYTVELEGAGIVAGPIAWTSGAAVSYIVPTGFSPRNYTYTIAFTDDYGDFLEHLVVITVEASEFVPPPAIPDYEISILISSFTVVAFSTVASMKKKKKYK